MINLKELQKMSNNTIKETANNLNIAVSTYNNYLIGTREPDIAMIKKLANYFQVSTDYLLGNEMEDKLDLTSLTTEQKELVELIQKLNQDSCRLLNAYANGLMESQKKQNELIKKYTKLDWSSLGYFFYAVEHTIFLQAWRSSRIYLSKDLKFPGVNPRVIQ